jgi:hypothetical protein
VAHERIFIIEGREDAMMTPTLLGFVMLLVGAFLFLFAVMRAEAGADRDRRRAAARWERAHVRERTVSTRVVRV